MMTCEICAAVVPDPIMLFLTDRKSHYSSLPPPKFKKNKKHVKRMKGAVVHCDFNLKREKKAVK